jgi:hypothetical protein
LIWGAKDQHDQSPSRVQHDIIHGAEQLGLPLDTAIAEVITALKLDAERVGLSGTAHSTPP